MIDDREFREYDKQPLLIAMVLQDIKDQLLQQADTSIVTIEAETPNSYFWSMFDPRNEEDWYDGFYGDERETPRFSMGIASDKREALDLLQGKGVVKRFTINSVHEDPIGLGHTIEFLRSFKIELNLTKYLRYYDAYLQAARPALEQYLELSGERLHVHDSAVSEAIETAFAKLSFNISTKTIRLTVFNKTVDVKRFNSKSSANYKIFAYLYNHPNEAFGRKELGLGLRGTVVKDIPKTMGFNGSLKNIFFTLNTKEQTLMLHPEKTLTKQEIEILKDVVNSNYMQK